MNSTNNKLGLGIEIVGGMSPAASTAMNTVVEGKRKLKQQGFRVESPEKLSKYTSLFVSPEPSNNALVIAERPFSRDLVGAPPQHGSDHAAWHQCCLC